MYTGRRGPQGCVVWAIAGNGERKPLNPRQELRNHSPTGFEWGYGGSGPAQLRSPFWQNTSATMTLR